MEAKQKTRRILISYVSLHNDLGGEGPGIGEDEDWRPVTEIASHLMKTQKTPPDVVWLLWETVYLREKGKTPDDQRGLCQLVKSILSDADIRIRDVKWDDEKDASDYGKAFRRLESVFEAIARETPGEFFVNVSTGTHAIQASLFILTARRRDASLIQVGQDPDRKESGFCLVTNLTKSMRAIDDAHTRRETRELRRAVPEVSGDVATKALRIAPAAQDPILLLGETGSGKTRLAREIAKARDIKVDEKSGEGRFVPVNCATLGTLADSELFGHVKGAFTGAVENREGFVAQANQGVLFLDEIGLLSPKVQGKLLKVLDDGQFRRLGSNDLKESKFFLICGTNDPLDGLVSRNKFRRDLYERIRTWTFEMPPLHKRKEELGEFVDDFLNEFNKDSQNNVRFNADARKSFIVEVRKALEGDAGRQLFAGNFRTLRGLVRRMATYALVEQRTAIRGGEAEITEQIVALVLRELQSSRGGAAKPKAERDRAETVKRACDALLAGAKPAPLDRVQLEYVIGLVHDDLTASQIEEKLFPDVKKRNKPSSMKKFFNRFGKGISIREIQKKLQEVCSVRNRH